MPIASHSYNLATAALTPVLHDLPPVVVAIDGLPGSGKTTLGRYLAWYFNVTLVETDLFLLQGQGFKHRMSDLSQVVSARLARERPIIIDGAAVHRLLGELGREAAFTIYVSNTGPSAGESPFPEVKAYEANQHPRETADLVVELCH
ncbi:AAA family ATPase [Oleiagrimonas sp. MCCC 1A03011]|uniref:AAA family ATPase n=1 Tax=Oleiagrimonas sp. MCCC 1A03011 TaxID=1926883 RepID=UPI0011BF9164|nr:AAA family ATPase [Oleiagrimonas sp. MCCC 1A03011]